LTFDLRATAIEYVYHCAKFGVDSLSFTFYRVQIDTQIDDPQTHKLTDATLHSSPCTGYDGMG